MPCSRTQRYCGSSILTSTARHRVWNQNEPATTMTVTFAESQHYIINPTNTRRAFDDGVEDRLHVRGRAADDAEHLGGCRLMLQSLAQFRGSGVLPLQRFGRVPGVAPQSSALV